MQLEVEVPWLVNDFYNDPTLQDPPEILSELVFARVLPQNIGYLRISTMSPPNNVSARDFLAFIEGQLLSLHNTRALIIDVRFNGGGLPVVGETLMKYFIDRPTLSLSCSPRLSDAVLALRSYYQQDYQLDHSSEDRFAHWKNVIVEPVEEELRYHNPVVIITNSNCFSACDTFVAGFASNHLATVVGQATGGGTGQPQWFDLPSEMARFRFSVVRGKLVNQTFLEGAGTRPDIALMPTAKDLALGVDSVLMQTHARLVEQLGGGIKQVVGKSVKATLEDKAVFQFDAPKVRSAFEEEQDFLRVSSQEADDVLRDQLKN